MTDARATLKNYHQAPRKVRLVADLVRGKTAEHALALLGSLPKRASEPLAKLIRSAVANSGAAAREMYVSKVQVEQGLVLKRSMPRARGRASAIHKKSSHIILSLSRKENAKPQTTNHKHE